jgi:hypothetical protein
MAEDNSFIFANFLRKDDILLMDQLQLKSLLTKNLMFFNLSIRLTERLPFYSIEKFLDNFLKLFENQDFTLPLVKIKDIKIDTKKIVLSHIERIFEKLTKLDDDLPIEHLFSYCNAYISKPEWNRGPLPPVSKQNSLLSVIKWSASELLDFITNAKVNSQYFCLIVYNKHKKQVFEHEDQRLEFRCAKAMRSNKTICQGKVKHLTINWYHDQICMRNFLLNEYCPLPWSLEKLHMQNVSQSWFQNWLEILGLELNFAHDLNFSNLQSISFSSSDSHIEDIDRLNLEMDIPVNSDYWDDGSYSLILFLIPENKENEIKKYEINISGKSSFSFMKAYRPFDSFILFGVDHFVLPLKINYVVKLPLMEQELKDCLNYVHGSLGTDFHFWIQIPDYSKVL